MDCYPNGCLSVKIAATVLVPGQSDSLTEAVVM